MLKTFIVSILLMGSIFAGWGPDYMIIGAQKSGTTALFKFLNQHPKVLNKRAEVHFFDRHFEEGLKWYKNQFPQKPDASFIIGDKTPYYLFHPIVPERVYNTCPNTKFIVILRNPVDRAYSQYWMNRFQGSEKRSFEQALEEEPELIAREEEKLLDGQILRSVKHQNYSYVSRGHYKEQLERWFSFFPREQFLIIDAKKLRDNPQKTMNRIFYFLGLSHFPLNLESKDNKSQYSAMNPATKKELKAHFKPYNHELEAFLDYRFNWD